MSIYSAKRPAARSLWLWGRVAAVSVSMALAVGCAADGSAPASGAASEPAGASSTASSAAASSAARAESEAPASESAASEQTAASEESGAAASQEAASQQAASSQAASEPAGTQSAASSGAASSASSTGSAGSGTPAVPAYEAELDAKMQELYTLQARAESDLDACVASAKAEYKSLPAEQQTQLRKVSICLSKTGQLTDLQAYYDQEMERIVDEMRQILTANGQPTDRADQALATYQEQKSSTYSAMIDKLYS